MSSNGERLPYFNLYTGDFRKIGERMSPAARGHFIWLLICQWDNGPLPSDIKGLRRLSPGLTQTVWEELAPHFELISSGLVHLPLEAMRAHAEKRQSTASEKAKVAADARWGRHRSESERDARSSASSMLGALPKQCLGDANQMSDSESESPPTHSGGMGRGWADAPTETGQPTLSLVRPLHRSADSALAAVIRIRGEIAGREMFDRAIQKRRDTAIASFTQSGLREDEARQLAELTLATWSWETWSTQFGVLITESKTKQSPGGWIRWRLTENQQPTERAATA